MKFRNATEALPALIREVLDAGETVESRNGTTKELIMQQITLTDPEPVITTPGRRVSLPAQIAEMVWMLAGRDDIEWLSHYLPRAKDFSDDGKTWRGAYGPRLRAFGFKDKFSDRGVDQLAHVVGLLNEDRGTRRAVINIYNPTIDTQPGKDIPCNNWLHFLPRDGKLHGHVVIRSNDLFWGWSGINAWEWTNLLTIVARLTGFERGSLTFSISSLHLYEKHWERAAAIADKWEGLEDIDFFSPDPQFSWSGDLAGFDEILGRWFNVEKHIREETIGVDIVATIQAFPETMLRSWLWVLYAWNRGDMSLLPFDVLGTALGYAAEVSPARKMPFVPPAEDRERFTQFVVNLHAEKDAAYGTSWKKRGEMLGIMANCARKVDRLGVEGGGDTAADTAIDLMVYLVKYLIWLEEQKGNSGNITEGPVHVQRVTSTIGSMIRTTPLPVDNEKIIADIKQGFDTLEHQVMEKREDRGELVVTLLSLAYLLAVRLWTAENPGVDNRLLKPAAVGHAERNADRAFNGYNL